MNHNEDIACNTIKIVSDSKSFDKRTGALTVNGGIGCKQQINTHSLICDCFLSKKSAQIENDLVVCGTVLVNNLIPQCMNVNLGSEEERFSKLYTNYVDTNDLYINNNLKCLNLKGSNININKNASFGKNTNDDPILNISNENKTVDINSDIFTIANSNDTLLQAYDKNIYLNSLLRVKYNVINIEKNQEIDYVYYPNSSFVIVKSKYFVNILLENYKNKNDDTDKLDDGTYLKIYNTGFSKIQILEYVVKQYESIELLFSNDEWIILSTSLKYVDEKEGALEFSDTEINNDDDEQNSESFSIN